MIQLVAGGHHIVFVIDDHQSVSFFDSIFNRCLLSEVRLQDWLRILYLSGELSSENKDKNTQGMQTRVCNDRS